MHLVRDASGNIVKIAFITQHEVDEWHAATSVIAKSIGVDLKAKLIPEGSVVVSRERFERLVAMAKATRAWFDWINIPPDDFARMYGMPEDDEHTVALCNSITATWDHPSDRDPLP